MGNELTPKEPFTGYEEVSVDFLQQKLEQMNADNNELATNARLGKGLQEDFQFFNHQVQVESENIRQEFEKRGIIKPRM